VTNYELRMTNYEFGIPGTIVTPDFWLLFQKPEEIAVIIRE